MKSKRCRKKFDLLSYWSRYLLSSLGWMTTKTMARMRGPKRCLKVKEKSWHMGPTLIFTIC